VNGAGTLVRATGAGSSFGNGGRFADKTGSKRHRYRATGSGAIGCGVGQPATGANMGIARRAFGHDGRCVGRAKANARRSTSGGSSHLSPGSARQPGLDDRVLRTTPSGRGKGKTAPVHEAEATPDGA
jgi:type IV secretory pathway TrbL component